MVFGCNFSNGINVSFFEILNIILPCLKISICGGGPRPDILHGDRIWSWLPDLDLAAAAVDSSGPRAYKGAAPSILGTLLILSRATRTAFTKPIHFTAKSAAAI